MRVRISETSQEYFERIVREQGSKVCSYALKAGDATFYSGSETRGTGRKRIESVALCASVEELLPYLRTVAGVVRVEAAGSFRRRRATIGDLDLIAAARDSER